MLKRYDQTEMLGLIEGDLDARSVLALQTRLARDPQARAMLEMMVRDRAALRAVPEPALPQDFLADLEPMLTRPMLIEPVANLSALEPAEFRRRYRRQMRGPRRWPLVAAAGLLLALLGGSWAIIASLLQHSGGAEDRLAINAQDRSSASKNTSPSTAHDADAVDVPGPGIVHHARPQLLGNPPSAVASANTSGLGPAEQRASNEATGDTSVIAADFAVVVQAKDAAAIEPAVSGAVASLGEQAALVRNFSYAEAQRLAEDYRVAHADPSRGGESQAPTVAAATSGAVKKIDLSRSELYQLAQRVREHLRSRTAASPPAVAGDTVGNATLTGSSSLAPTLEQQLDFSSRGAAYTLAVPASQLAATIERLSLAGGATSTAVRMLPSLETSDRAGSSPTSPTLVWLSEVQELRRAMAQLSHAGDHTIVLVPVMVSRD